MGSSTSRTCSDAPPITWTASWAVSRPADGGQNGGNGQANGPPASRRRAVSRSDRWSGRSDSNARPPEPHFGPAHVQEPHTYVQRVHSVEPVPTVPSPLSVWLTVRDESVAHSGRGTAPVPAIPPPPTELPPPDDPSGRHDLRAAQRAHCTHGHLREWRRTARSRFVTRRCGFRPIVARPTPRG